MMSAPSDIGAAVNALTRALASLKTGAPKRGRKRAKRGAKSMPLVPQQPGPSTVLSTPRRRKQKVPRGIRGFGDGDIVFSRTEILTDLKTTPDTTESFVQLYIGPQTDKGKVVTFTFLDRLYKLFSRVRWEYLMIEYRPSCSAMTSGSLAVGVDWSSAKQKIESFTRERVYSLTPLIQTQLAQPCKLGPFNSNRLMTRQWYDTALDDTADTNDLFPGLILGHLTYDSSKETKALGSIWAHYRVRLSGTEV